MKKVSYYEFQMVSERSSDNPTDIREGCRIKMRVNLSIRRKGGVYLYNINTPYRRMIDGGEKMKNLK